MEDEEITANIESYTVTVSPPLGSGVFGMVYKAVHRTSEETFAATQIVIAEPGQISDYKIKMAESELTILRDLQNHQNIVQLCDYFIKNNVCWLVMELCDLNNLGSYLRRNKHLPLWRRLKIMQQGADALIFMHNQTPPIIHRDIKLENILIKQEAAHDLVKIAHFGVSKISEICQSPAQALGQGQGMSTMCASRFFMAPEFFAQSEQGIKYDSSFDVFSLGLTYLVIIDQHSLSDLIPLSVHSKMTKQYVSIGYEMVESFRNKQDLPKVIDKESETCKLTRRVKRVVQHMTRFTSRQRKHIDEVKDEMDEIVEDIDNKNAPPAKSKWMTLEDQSLDQQIEYCTELVLKNLQSENDLKMQIRVLKDQLEDKQLADAEMCKSDIAIIEKLDHPQKQLYEEVLKGKLRSGQTVQVKVLGKEHPAGIVPREASILVKLRHPHIIKLIGICTKVEPVWIILELMENRSLPMYLRHHRNTPLHRLTSIASQIANGLSYLEKHCILHRDVRATNVIMCANESLVKLCGFAMSVHPTTPSRKEDMFAVKWTAPEVFSSAEFSAKSDVWSFGVALYEIITFGNLPFQGMTNAEVEEKVVDGYRMPKPTACECPDRLYNMMLKCWSERPEDRPTFEVLFGFLDSFEERLVQSVTSQ